MTIALVRRKNAVSGFVSRRSSSPSAASPSRASTAYAMHKPHGELQRGVSWNRFTLSRPDRTADGPEPKRQRTEKEDTATRVAALLEAIRVVDAYAKISGLDGGDTQQSAGEPKPRGGNTQQLVSVARDWVLEGALEALQTGHPLPAPTYTHTPIGLVQHLKSQHATALDLNQEGEPSIDFMAATVLRAMELLIAGLKADYDTLYAAQEVQYEIAVILKPEASSSDGDQLVEDLEREREQYKKGIRTLNNIYDQHNPSVKVLKGELEKVEAKIGQIKDSNIRREQQWGFARDQFTAYSEAASARKKIYLSEQKRLKEIASAYSPS